MLWKNRWSSSEQPNKPPPYQNCCYPIKFSSNHPCCPIVSAAFKYVPQPTVTTFAFSSVFILLLLLMYTWLLNSSLETRLFVREKHLEYDPLVAVRGCGEEQGVRGRVEGQGVRGRGRRADVSMLAPQAAGHAPLWHSSLCTVCVSAQGYIHTHIRQGFSTGLPHIRELHSGRYGIAKYFFLDLYPAC